MASILRSSKFVRYIAGFARNVVVNTPREFDGNLINAAQAQCVCAAGPRNLATQTSAQHDQNLEKSLRRLDQDVRKAGRISRRDIEEVLEEIRLAQTATSSQSLLVIRCCGNLVPEELPEIRTKLVQEIWNTLNRLNVPMDISHYNALLRVYLENDHVFSPTDILSELESKGIEPNRVTYQRLIARYCQDGDIDGATKILEYMREKQLPVNENVFNALVMGHSQSGDMDSARGILGVMSQAGLEPSADTYTTLLSGYAKKGDIETIKHLLDECETKEIFLLDKDYLDIIYSLAVNNHLEHISFILSKCRKGIGYNQDAINLILRLINKGYEDAALEVMKTMPRSTKSNGTMLPVGNFFIKQLVKSNKPVEKIVEYCNKLEAENMYEKGLLLATETALHHGNDQLAYALLEKLVERGIEIRQHFFWPLIVSKGNEDPTGRSVLKVLEKMQSFNITPTAETIRDYVIPNLKGKSSEIIEKLRDVNISIGSAASSLIISLLQKHEIQEAAIIARQVKAYYDPDVIKRPLTNAFNETKDVDSYITILRSIFFNLDLKSLARPNSPEPVDKFEVVGNFVLDLAWRRDSIKMLPLILNKLVVYGISISATAAEQIEAKLGEKMTEEISSLLGKLSSGELTPVPLEKEAPVYTPTNQMNVAQLERLIANLEKKGQEVKGLKRQLLSLYYREKDLEKTEAVLQDLKRAPDFVMTDGLYAQLMDLHAYHENLDKALGYFDEFQKSTQSDFSIDEGKIIRLSYLLTKNNRFDEALQFLEVTPRESKSESRSYPYTSQVWRYLNHLAEEGRAEDLDKLFNTLVNNDFIEGNNIVLGPLIKVHLLKKDFDKALEKFQWCVSNFKATPWKNEFACQLIQAEDAEKLQKLTDLSTIVHGEINSLYDLVFAFVECGRIRQARKILETPGLQSRPQKINTICERYRQEGLIKPLEDLKDATKDLNHIDRSDIYYQLLLSYIKQDEPDKALGLWTQMQEEDIPPSDQFLSKLGMFLRSREMEVPFAIPQLPQMRTDKPKQQHVVRHVQTVNTNTFHKKLQEDDLDGCLEIYNLGTERLSASDLSFLIEKLVQNQHIEEAKKIALQLIQKGSMPLSRIFKFLLNKIANSGDVDGLNQFSSKLSDAQKKELSFDNRLCHANLVSGNAKGYLAQLEREIDTATEENLDLVANKFPRGGAYGILERHPELTEKFEEVALKYAKQGILAPLNVLWTHYFSIGKDERANQIWTEHLKDAPRLMFQRIVQTAREQKEENLILKLLDHLKGSNVTPGALGNAYSCLLDILVSKERNEEVVEIFEKCTREIPLGSINRTAILRVNEVYQKLGRPFNHPIPQKNKDVNKSDDHVESY